MNRQQTMYEATCDGECGETRVIPDPDSEQFCLECSELQTHTVEREVHEYTAVIAVDGEINTRSVRGVVGRTEVAGDKAEAEQQAIANFHDEPEYNTDFSVNKERFPDGEWLDNWGYDIDSARVVHVERSDTLSPLDVTWRRVRDKV